LIAQLDRGRRAIVRSSPGTCRDKPPTTDRTDVAPIWQLGDHLATRRKLEIAEEFRDVRPVTVENWTRCSVGVAGRLSAPVFAATEKSTLID
jgi:hypothetical protein